MLKDIFSKKIEIIIGDKKLTFNSLAEFEFSLAARTSVPFKKTSKMMRSSLASLKKEARIIKRIENNLIVILTETWEKPESINLALREIDIQTFSRDHDWRLLIAGLNKSNDSLNPFRQVALTKYIQYLASIQEMIKYFYTNKKQNMTFSSLEVINFNEPRKQKLNSLSRSNDLSIGRMPKGERVIIKMKSDKKIAILLSKNPYKLICDQSNINFLDQEGKKYSLHHGRNCIGRDTKNDIAVDPSLRDISRTHLMVEVDDGNTISLIDLSLHGTYLPKQYLVNDFT